eukprot:5951048-Prorocentrum_lima.AAC.1
MDIIRQHNITVERQRDRGEWSFYGNPPTPSRETQRVGGVPGVDGASLRRPPADRDFPQAAAAASSSTPIVPRDVNPYSMPPAPPGLYAGTDAVGASSMSGGVGGPRLPVVGGGGA